MNPRNEELRLKDIHSALIDILNVRNLLAHYPDNPLISRVSRDAINYQLIVLGEAITGLSREYRKVNPHIKWQEIIDLRNQLAHQYFEIDASTVDIIIEERLRALFEFVNPIFE